MERVDIQLGQDWMAPREATVSVMTSMGRLGCSIMAFGLAFSKETKHVFHIGIGSNASEGWEEES
jgi:hypothetical protein